jgi:serine/threonine protein kinase
MMMNLFGIAYRMMILHGQKIIHRDLKPENVLLTDNLEPKISDLGLSKFIEAGRPLSHTADIGTPLYWAPEDCEGLGEYDFSVNVYAYGILAYSTISSMSPFEE